ncbi:MAG: SDR family oxidoreductase [Myxococcota bacterium]|nr:SDR family oxidoreductase [Myxococcota bacterium]
MTRLCDGRVVIVTGAGAGIGRAHALALAEAGATVIVNDLGTSNHGEGASEGPAQTVAKAITDAGGRALANTDDVTDSDAMRALVDETISTFGTLHAVVNNAGFVRDRMFVSCGDDEWDAVMNVHLRGHLALSRAAAQFWRAQAKAGDPVDARIINTSSGAGLRGSVGQSAYSAAKAGILALTLVQAAELKRYGVTANVLSPAARTRMTEAVFAEMMARPETGFDRMDPANISPLVVYLASDRSGHVSGRSFEVEGGLIALNSGWRRGAQRSQQARWDAQALGSVIDELIAEQPADTPPYGA